MTLYAPDFCLSTVVDVWYLTQMDKIKRLQKAWQGELARRNQGIRRMREDKHTLESIGLFYGLTKQRVSKILKSE